MKIKDLIEKLSGLDENLEKVDYHAQLIHDIVIEQDVVYRQSAEKEYDDYATNCKKRNEVLKFPLSYFENKKENSWQFATPASVSTGMFDEAKSIVNFNI